MNIDIGHSNSHCEIFDAGVFHLGGGEGADITSAALGPVSYSFTVVDAIGVSAGEECHKSSNLKTLASAKVPHVVVEAALDVEESRLVDIFGLFLLLRPQNGRSFWFGREVSRNHFIGHAFDVVPEL